MLILSRRANVCFYLFSTANPPFSIALFFSSCCKRHRFSPSLRPPLPKKLPFQISAHGRTWDDPYHWMRNTDDPDFEVHLNRENSYTEAFMADTKDLQRKLVAEMKNRMPRQISSPPERWGPWLYYQYVPTGKEYPVLCRRPWSRNGLVKTLLGYMRGLAKEEVLLDWNEIAEQFGMCFGGVTRKLKSTDMYCMENMFQYYYNAGARGYVHIGSCRVSPDHKFLAYTLDITGGELFVLQIKDLKTGFTIPKSRVEGVVNLAWAKDSSILLYTISDETQRPYKVFCKGLGSDDLDTLVFTESDLNCCVDITSTKDGKFITVNSNSRTSSEEGDFQAYFYPLPCSSKSHYSLPEIGYCWKGGPSAYKIYGGNCFLETIYVIDAANLQGGLRLVRKRVPGVQYFMEHHYGFFYILTNASEDSGSIAGDYHLAICRAGDVQLGNWQDIIQAGPDVGFHDMDIFDGYLVLFLQREGSPMICSIGLPLDYNCKHPMNLEDLNPWFFPLPSNTCSIIPGSNHCFMMPIYRVVLSSPVMPDVIVDYDMSKRKFTIVQQEEVFDITGNNGSGSCFATNPSKVQSPNDSSFHNINEQQNWIDFSKAFLCERKEVTSHDGVSIPLTILYSRKAQRNGQCPGILQGYGAYGEVLDKSWCSDRISLLERGWVLAFADVRGGGDGGVPWHRSGSGPCKLNSIYDFIACSRYLVNEGYVDKDRFGAIGHSAGGLLVGAAINMYPDLFSVGILKVPFLDICNTLLDPSLPLTVMDYEEFGDPSIRTEFENICSYSPYDNISSRVCYPSMLVTTSLHDTRVGAWEAAKWVAKVRNDTCPDCSCSVILKTNMSGGHFGEGGRFKHCEETAFEYAFLIKAMGLHVEEQGGVT